MLVALVRNSVATSTLCRSIHVPEIHWTTPSKCNVWLPDSRKRSHPTVSNSRGISCYFFFGAAFLSLLIFSQCRSRRRIVFVVPQIKANPLTHHICAKYAVANVFGSSHYLVVAPHSSLAQNRINCIINQHCTSGNGHGHRAAILKSRVQSHSRCQKINF